MPAEAHSYITSIFLKVHLQLSAASKITELQRLYVFSQVMELVSWCLIKILLLSASGLCETVN